MEKQKYIASLDIGTAGIVSSLAQVGKDNRVKVIGLIKMPSEGVKRGIIFNMEDTVKAIKSTIEEISVQTGIRINQVNVNMNGQHIHMSKKTEYLSIHSNDSEISNIGIQKLINHKNKPSIDYGDEILHVIPAEYTVTNKQAATHTTGMPKGNAKVGYKVITGQQAAISNIKKCINLAGLEINNLVSEPIASSFSVLSNDEKEKGVVLVDIGAGTTNVVIYYNDIIRHLAVIPFAGNFITSELKKYFNISGDQAENLKVQFGSALVKLAPAEKTTTVPGIDGREDIEISLKDSVHIIQWCLEQIIDAILFEIKDSGFFSQIGNGIVLTGGGALLENINILFKDKTGLNVRLGLPSKLGNNENLFELNDPIYSTSIGLLNYYFRK